MKIGNVTIDAADVGNVCLIVGTGVAVRSGTAAEFDPADVLPPYVTGEITAGSVDGRPAVGRAEV